ncbi:MULTISPECIES: N-acetylmuramoyl-L-alanine amidase [Methylomonas]|uniref:N-acetylmuramoyl-L-alanine amidase n=1 Tax=Methylomonas TaxID=416 RepID=UPI001231D39C|nr:N-acetylmuramoyl-L-alanine amidase [Methylomonas rhizoryzae]
MRLTLQFFWLLAICSFAAATHAGQARIQNLHFAGSAKSLVFELTETPHYRHFLLKNPDRLVIDFPNTELAAALAQPPAGQSLALAVRSGVRNKTDLRVVVELAGAADIRASVNGKILQLDLNGKPGTTPVRQQTAGKTTAPIKEAKIKPVAEPVKSAPAKPAKTRGRDIVIAVDAGHGGKDVGAQGGNGTKEKDVVFAIAKRLAGEINRQPGMKAVMIRNGDYFVKLRDRVKIARDAKADLLVSIHADAFDDASAHGASIYTLANKGASSHVAQFLADSENAADGSGEAQDDVLASVLMDLTTNAAKEASQHIGNRVLKSVKSVGHLHRTSVQKAGFVVLKSPIPSILVETAFISNPDEERRLNSTGYQQQMAKAVFNGIMAHFKQYAPADTSFAQLQKSGHTPAKLATRQKSAEPPLARAAIPEVGDKVVGSSPATTRHVIGRGETLHDIARQYGVSVREIRSANGGNAEVRVGRVLQIPRSS